MSHSNSNFPTKQYFRFLPTLQNDRGQASFELFRSGSLSLVYDLEWVLVELRHFMLMACYLKSKHYIMKWNALQVHEMNWSTTLELVQWA